MSGDLFDLNHVFFRPLRRRVAVTGITFGWAIFEFITGTPSWGIMFLALGLWCGWCFLGPNPYYRNES